MREKQRDGEVTCKISETSGTGQCIFYLALPFSGLWFSSP